MQFMAMAKSTKNSQGDVILSEQIMGGIAKVHRERRKAHTLLGSSELQPRSEGSRMKDSRGRRTVIDGPFAETKEVLGGCTLSQAMSQKEMTESILSSAEEGGGLCRQS